MHKATLRSAIFEVGMLDGADFSGADLRDIRINLAYIQNVNLSGSDMRGANLTGVGFMGANLSGANLEGIKYDKTTLQSIAGSKLDGARMSADLQEDLEKLRSGSG